MRWSRLLNKSPWPPVFFFMTAIAAAFFIHRSPFRSTGPVEASYSLLFEGEKTFPPDYGVFEVFGGQRMTGFIVVADDQEAGVGAEGTRVRLSALKASHKNLIQEFENFLEPPPPLPFALMTAPIIRVAEGSGRYHASSTKVFIAPVDVLRQTHVAAWRLTVHPWSYRGDPFADPRFWRVLEARPLAPPN
jgi:hypothetical protein